MKLNYRDKVILGILLAVVLLLVGFFGMIKPKSKEIKESKATLATKQTEEKQIKDKIKQIEPLKKTISQTVTDTNNIVDKFVDVEEIDTPMELDRFMQSYADKNKLKVTTLDVGEVAEAPIEFYYYTPTTYGEASRAAADINGTYQAAVDEKLDESTKASMRTAETAMSTQYGFTATGTKADIWQYMKDIEDNGSTIIINSVELSEVEEENAEGEAAAPKNPDADEMTGWADDEEFNATFVVTLYSMYKLEEPVIDVD